MSRRRQTVGETERRGNRRRLVRRVVLHAGFAVLFTIASAMVCARYVFFTSVSVTIDRMGDPPTRWPGPVPKGWPATPQVVDGRFAGLLSATWRLSPGRWVSDIDVQEKVELTHTSAEGRLFAYEIELWPMGMTRTVYGFPIPSMLTDWIGDSSGGKEARWPYSGVSLMRQTPRSYPLFVLPVVPWWPGFAANTLLVFSMTFGVPAAVRWARRRRRRALGLCVYCGYELAGAGKCSECGGAGDFGCLLE